ncbi:MAG: 50S ribosome-binding GTPase [Candidatus ainarchaeum sp.]|nr:50S ribosome-binding GTPase [Candidatus ainarchaeum sp.]MDD3975834.1 50S ribosome-binding GTPase [Candidatus ainarchaeum sp.]
MKFPQIINSKEFIEIIINQTKKENDSQDYLKYINHIQNKIIEKLSSVINKLPDYTKMNEYYLTMSKNICPITTMDKHRNHYLTTIVLINKMSEKYKRSIKRERDKRKRNFLKKEYLGRIASIIKKLDSTNKILKTYTKDFGRIADPKKYFSIVIVGLPNSGKTTLLTKITDANPEINTYEFTTKSLNLGYFKIREEIIQVVDTPGLIHLEFKEMNFIEKNAIVAIKTLADIVLFLYNKNIDLKKQEEMYEYLKKENPDKIFYVHSSFGGNFTKGKEINIKDILLKKF